MDWEQDMPQRLRCLEKAWWPQSVASGAWLRQQDMLMSCKTLGRIESDRDIVI